MDSSSTSDNTIITTTIGTSTGTTYQYDYNNGSIVYDSSFCDKLFDSILSNIGLRRSDYCNKEEEVSCETEGSSLCIMCKYRKKDIDIPKLYKRYKLEEKMKKEV